MSRQKRILTLHLKHKYWEQIRGGSKLWEYRKVTDYWDKRLAKKYDEIHLLSGYPKKGNTSRRLVRKWYSPHICRITHDEFGPEPVLVYAIDVSEEVI